MGSPDQAARLRELIARRDDDAGAHTPKARVIAVTGGKGGVGKTNVAANLAVAFADLGNKVVILDADYALANVDILLGFNPKYSIEHVLSGEKSIAEVVVDGPGGIKVVPASSGSQWLTSLDDRQQNYLYNALGVLEKHFDQIIVDTAAGISDDVFIILRAAADVVVVTNPEPPAFVDSYALIKHLFKVNSGARIRLIVNRVRSTEEGDVVFNRIADTVKKFLGGTIEYLGYVAEDAHVQQAVRQRRPFYIQFPKSSASQCVYTIATRLLKDRNDGKSPGFLGNLKVIMSGKGTT